MEHYEKLSIFFKSKGLSQSEVGQRIGYSRSSMSKFLKGDSVIDSNFILKVVKEFPDVDLKYIFSKEDEEEVEDLANMIMEPPAIYELSPDKLEKELEIILKKLTNVKNVLAQNRHKK